MHVYEIPMYDMKTILLLHVYLVLCILHKSVGEYLAEYIPLAIAYNYISLFIAIN